jgi:hypothetical protein
MAPETAMRVKTKPSWSEFERPSRETCKICATSCSPPGKAEATRSSALRACSLTRALGSSRAFISRPGAWGGALSVR